ncbi:hypothetical protein Tco_1443437 [Tanacetum coccineum]
MTPNPAKVQTRKRKGKQVARESSSPKPSLKLSIKQHKPTFTTPLPPNDDQERDDIIEATQLSLALDKTAKLYRIEPESHKENPKKNDVDKKKDDKKDDNDDDDNDDLALIRTRVTGSSEIRREKMQTPIPSPPRSPRTDLSSDKAINQELMGIKEKVDKALKDIVPKLSTTATNDLINDNLPRIVANVIKKERESLQAVVPALISQEFVAHAPKIIEELFRIYMQNTVLNVHPTTSTSIPTTYDLQHQLYLKMKSNLQAQVVDLELWDILKAKFEKSSALVGSCRNDAFHKRDHDKHQGDDAPPKRKKM